MTDEQDEILERQQSHALKLIFGTNISAGKMREMAGIPTLRQRRIELCDKFANKALKTLVLLIGFHFALEGLLEPN